MNEPQAQLLALLVAFVLGYGLCVCCAVLVGGREASRRERELELQLMAAEAALHEARADALLSHVATWEVRTTKKT